MAIWQFNIYFIPKESLLVKYGYLPEQLPRDTERYTNYIMNGDMDADPNFEDALAIHWWLNLNIDLKIILPLLAEFGNLIEWTERTEGLRSFGDDETNDISVCFDNETGKVLELDCRINLLEIDKYFIDKILQLGNKFDCLFMDVQGRLFPPTISALFDIIQLSNAKKFVSDPKQFFDDLSKGIIKPD